MEIGVVSFCIAAINRVYVLDKVMIDIEDMSGISEAEDLFTPEKFPSEAAHGEAPISITAVSTPNWIKIQYLTNMFLVPFKKSSRFSIEPLFKMRFGVISCCCLASDIFLLLVLVLEV